MVPLLKIYLYEINHRKLSILLQVLTELGEPYNKMELASFMSCSKGYMGECGLRGGYAEVINMCPKVKAMYLKCISAMLCPTVLGQACLDVVVNPPREGEPSYQEFMKEKQAVLDSLKVWLIFFLSVIFIP